MFLPSDIQSHDLPGHNFKVPDKLLSKHTQDKVSGPVYGEPEHEENHLLVENGTNWLQIEFPDYCVCHTFMLLS